MQQLGTQVPRLILKSRQTVYIFSIFSFDFFPLLFFFDHVSLFFSFVCLFVFFLALLFPNFFLVFFVFINFFLEFFLFPCPKLREDFLMNDLLQNFVDIFFSLFQ